MMIHSYSIFIHRCITYCFIDVQWKLDFERSGMTGYLRSLNVFSSNIFGVVYGLHANCNRAFDPSDRISGSRGSCYPEFPLYCSYRLLVLQIYAISHVNHMSDTLLCSFWSSFITLSFYLFKFLSPCRYFFTQA